MSSFPKARLLRRVVGGIALAAALVACGGGTSQYDPFEPGRLIVFGDENSLLDAQGRRWGVNYIDENESGTADDEFVCGSNAIWVQRLASHYGFVFAECNPDNKTVKAFFRSQQNAGVDDLAQQIQTQIDTAVESGGGFREGDLVTVMIGSHDILRLYQQHGTRRDDDLKADAARLGERLAAQVNRLVELGAKVILTTLPDLGLSPYARAQEATYRDGRDDLLSALTSEFNNALGVNILLDGRYIGLVQSDVRVQLMEESPGSFGLDNEKDAACLASAPLPTCTSLTLVDKATNSNFLWADATHLGPRAHTEIADLAIDRAEDNPF